MARGSREVGTVDENVGTAQRTEVEAAERSVNADPVAAVSRVQNAGGGDIKVDADALGTILVGVYGQNPRAVASDGSIITTNRDGLSFVIKPNGDVTSVKQTTVEVTPAGVTGVRVAGVNYVMSRTRVDVTSSQRDAFIAVNLPPTLRGAAFDKAGNLNGWRLNPKAIADKDLRAAAYRLMDKSGRILVPKDSPLGKQLSGQLSKAGYSRTTIGEFIKAMRETGTAYVAGQDAAGTTAPGLERRRDPGAPATG